MFDQGPPTTTDQVSDVIDAWIAGRGCRQVTDRQVEIATIARMIDQLGGMLRLEIAGLDRSGQATDHGTPVSTAVWLQHTTKASPAAAERQVRSGRVLTDMLPRTADLLVDGELSIDQVDQLCTAVDFSETTRQAAGGHEQTLLDIIRPVPMRKLREVLRHWRYTVDPADSLDDENRQYERRALSVSQTFEGMVALNGTLDPISGAAVKAVIDALAAPVDKEDRRAPKVRRADALTQLCRQALDSRQTPEVADERPHVTVTVDLATLAGTSTGPADLDGVGAISGAAARQIACDAGLVRVLTNGPSEVLDVGRRTRTVGPALRRALNVRDRGCVFRGCGRPLTWTEAHHVVHWADGGPTTIDNLALLCAHHHRVIHQQGWTLTLGPDRRWRTHPPDGQPYADPWTGHRQRRRPRR